MALLFGNLTTAFSDYAKALQVVELDPVGGVEQLAQATDHLYSSVDSDALSLLYVGIGMAIATFVSVGTWTWTGEAATRRIRERYLAAVLRQNTAWHDKSGAGAITSRIEVRFPLALCSSKLS